MESTDRTDHTPDAGYVYDAERSDWVKADEVANSNTDASDEVPHTDSAGSAIATAPFGGVASGTEHEAADTSGNADGTTGERTDAAPSAAAGEGEASA